MKFMGSINIILFIDFLYFVASCKILSAFRKHGGIMRGVALWFIAAAVVAALCGMVWGIQMSASHDHTLSPAHGHLNLLGWVSCSIFAFYYHAVPDAADGMLPRAHFALSVSSIALLAPGIAMAIQGQGELLAKLGSVLALLSMGLFGWVVLRASRISRADTSRQGVA